MDGRACKQYSSRSCNTSTFSAMRFAEYPLTCQCKKGFKDLEFSLVVFSHIMAVKGSNMLVHIGRRHCECCCCWVCVYFVLFCCCYFFGCLFVCSFVCLFVCLFICCFVGLFICCFVGLFICFVYLLLCWFVYLLVCLFVALLVCCFACFLLLFLVFRHHFFH